MNLRRLKNKDSLFMLEWMRDPDISQMFQFDINNMTEEKVKSFIRNSFTDSHRHYAVLDETDTYMGTVSLKNIDHNNKSAEYAISLRQSAIGKGYSKFATFEILKIAFFELNLNKVYLNVLSDNIRAIKFYEKFKFTYEGEFIEHVFVRGEFRNLKLYRMLKKEYEKMYTNELEEK